MSNTINDCLSANVCVINAQVCYHHLSTCNHMYSVCLMLCNNELYSRKCFECLFVNEVRDDRTESVQIDQSTCCPCAVGLYLMSDSLHLAGYGECLLFCKVYSLSWLPIKYPDDWWLCLIKLNDHGLCLTCLMNGFEINLVNSKDYKIISLIWSNFCSLYYNIAIMFIHFIIVLFCFSSKQSLNVSTPVMI